MARIRSIKPEFWTDEKVVALSPLARLLFIGMWNFVDDYGRAEYSPLRLKMQILPADSAEVGGLLGEIEGAKLIVVYNVEDKRYFEVRGFTKHQKVDKRSPSKIPSPTQIPPNSPEPSRKIPLEGIKEGIKETSSSLRSEENPPNGATKNSDWKAILFEQGLSDLAELAGKPKARLRSLVGLWLKDAQNDHQRVLSVILDAKSQKPIDPVSWIAARLKPANGNGHDPPEPVLSAAGNPMHRGPGGAWFSIDGLPMRQATDGEWYPTNHPVFGF